MLRIVFLLFIAYASKSYGASHVTGIINCDSIDSKKSSPMRYKYNIEIEDYDFTIHYSYVKYLSKNNKDGSMTLVEDGRRNKKDIISIVDSNKTFIFARGEMTNSEIHGTFLQAIYNTKSGLMVLQKLHSAETVNNEYTISHDTTLLNCEAPY
jgi:hypothetical protein